MTAKAKTLAGEAVERGHLIPHSGAEHVTVSGSSVTGRSLETVQAVLRMSMDSQGDI